MNWSGYPAPFLYVCWGAVRGSVVITTLHTVSTVQLITFVHPAFLIHMNVITELPFWSSIECCLVLLSPQHGSFACLGRRHYLQMSKAAADPTQGCTQAGACSACPSTWSFRTSSLIAVVVLLYRQGTTGQKAITRRVPSWWTRCWMFCAKRLKAATACRGSSWPTRWVGVQALVWVHCSYPRYARSTLTESWTRSVSCHHRR